ANGQLLVGLDEPREGARGFYDLIVRRASFHTHAIDWYLETLKALRVPVHWNFDWLPIRPVAAAEVRRKWQTDAARWIVLQPGARWSNKRWPVEHFAAVIRALALERSDFRFAILGGDADRDLGQTLANVEPGRCLDLTGKISLSEMVE